jgi:hypothetical protein
MRRFRLLLACSVLVVPGVSSCGSDGTESGGDATETPVAVEDLVSPDALAVAEAIVAELEPEPAMVAVGYALDRGYTAPQIIDAAMARILGVDGTIDGIAPELVSWGLFADLPVGGPAGLRSGPRGGALISMTAPEPMPFAPIRAADWLSGLSTEFDAVVSGRRTVSAPSAGRITTEPRSPEDEPREMATIMIGAVVELSALGYSAEQIITGILLGEMSVSVVGSGSGPIGCWQLIDSADGSVIRPSSPPLEGALQGTTTCRAALDDMARAETSGTTTPTRSDSTTAPPAAPTGDTDGLYVGTFELVSQPWGDFDLTASRVELALVGQSVSVMVDFTLRAGVRSINDNTVCAATVRRVFSGTGSMAASIDVPVSPELQEIIALEGPGCGISDDWETTAQADLEADFAEEEVLSLVGQFRDGTFTGNFTELFLVTATE